MEVLRHLLGRKGYTHESATLLSDASTWAGDDTKAARIPSPKSPPPWSRKYTTGWRSTVVLQILLGSAVLILNVSLAIWCYARFHIEQGVASVYSGPCTTVKHATSVLHLGVNILSTLLFGASNYCMQILNATTRKDIDTAHARRKWVSVGVASFKNIRYIDRKKTFLFFLLGISSIPLHLLWNSAFIDTLSSNEYVYSAVTESFLDGAPWNTSKAFLPITQYPDEAQAMLDLYTSRNPSLKKMNNQECVNTYYSVSFMTKYSNVLLVYSNDRNNDSLLCQGHNVGNETFQEDVTSSSLGLWVAGRDDKLPQGNASDWNPFESYQDTILIWLSRQPGEQAAKTIYGSVQYCLAQETERSCSLEISAPILVSVVICNIIKLICFILTLSIGGSMYPLLTNGDAIQSFLRHPDTNLANRCLASKADVKHNKAFWPGPALPIPWQKWTSPWAKGAPISCWLATFIPGIALIIGAVIIAIKNDFWAGGASHIASQGFGRPSLTALVGYRPVNILPAYATLLTNTPQILVSYIYIAYNNLFTHMLAASELIAYSAPRAPQHLCVSFPRGQQRSRRFLQVPYAWGIPIMAASVLLHWLISQSLFLVRIAIYDYNGTLRPGVFVSTTGYSPEAIIFALCMGGAMLAAVLGVGFGKRFPPTMPVAACCSASLAAVCRGASSVGREDIAVEKLRWGELEGARRLNKNDRGEVGRAGFSAGKVLPLMEGRVYA